MQANRAYRAAFALPRRLEGARHCTRLILAVLMFCGLSSGGLRAAVVAWGDNGAGETNVPPDLGDVVSVAKGGAFCLALRRDGTVVGWGDNSQGQTNVPAGLTNAVAIAAGREHALAILSDGNLVAWGDDVFGECDVPAGLSNVCALAAGDGHSLALRSDGTVVAWGDNSFGQTNIPAGLTNVSAIAVGPGGNFCLALIAEGAPFITAQPVSRTVYSGYPVQFRAAATGAWPPTYQ
jgi:hypothetical protein